MSSTAVQHLTCRYGNHPFTRPAGPGRPPVFCPEHRQYGQAVASVKTIKATEVPPAPIAPNHTQGRHKSFADLLMVAMARVPVMLVGPAGSGKTTAARHLADELGLSVDTQSCNPQMSAWDLMGFIDANGTYRGTALRRAFEFGGVFLLDEIDASNPQVLVTLNAVASTNIGEAITFPDGERPERHQDFVLVAGANTYGDGASDQYVGREQLDAATLDRFAAIEWGYDETIETMACGDSEWASYVQSVRRIVKAQGLDLLVTPRASINGAALLRAGMSRTKVESMVVYKGASSDTVRSIKATLKAEKAAATPAPERSVTF